MLSKYNPTGGFSVLRELPDSCSAGGGGRYIHEKNPGHHVAEPGSWGRGKKM